MSTSTKIARAPFGEKSSLSPATYATLVAMVLVLLLSAISLTAASREEPARPAYDPSVGLLGLADPE